MQKFTVDRKTWYRGQGASGSRLCRTDGMMCCLGHIGLQCGYEESDMIRVGYPSHVKGPSKWPAGLNTTSELNGNQDTVICHEMTKINDDEDIPDAHREIKLKALALDAGFELDFIN